MTSDALRSRRETMENPTDFRRSFDDNVDFLGGDSQFVNVKKLKIVEYCHIVLAVI